MTSRTGPVPPSRCSCSHAREQHISGYFDCLTVGCRCEKYVPAGQSAEAQPARIGGAEA